MRITATDGYHGHVFCELLDYKCEAHYCRKHRLLWSDCDTMKRGIEGDRDVINGTRLIYDLGDCPACEKESEDRKWLREVQSHLSF